MLLDGRNAVTYDGGVIGGTGLQVASCRPLRVGGMALLHWRCLGRLVGMPSTIGRQAVSVVASERHLVVAGRRR
jgi:hypothetical protein